MDNAIASNRNVGWSLQDPGYWVLAATIVFAIVVGLLNFNVAIGDGYIYLVYARNTAHGAFLQYNPGEFSSGATSPLWALILSIPFLALDDMNAVVGCKILAIACLAALPFCAFLVAQNYCASSTAAALAVIPFCLWLPQLATFSLGLQETGFFCLVLVLCLWRFVIVPRSERKHTIEVSLIDALLVGVLPVSRPESALLAFVFGFWILLETARKHQYKAMLPIGFGLVLPAALYYGLLLLRNRLAFALFPASAGYGRWT